MTGFQCAPGRRSVCDFAGVLTRVFTHLLLPGSIGTVPSDRNPRILPHFCTSLATPDTESLVKHGVLQIGALLWGTTPQDEFKSCLRRYVFDWFPACSWSPVGLGFFEVRVLAPRLSLGLQNTGKIRVFYRTFEPQASPQR